MSGLCDNCRLNNICEIYLKHSKQIEIAKCSYKDLIVVDNTSSVPEIDMSIHRNRDMSIDLKTLYPMPVKKQTVGTCQACGKSDVNLEECNGCHKLICWECACTNAHDDSVYCPDCMSDTATIDL